MKIGMDIAKISRFESLTANNIPSKIYSADEAKYILSKKNAAETAAGIFAAKEAFLKAAGGKITAPYLNEITVMHSKDGAPEIKLTGKASEIFDICSENISLTVSHDGDYATAAVYICQDKFAQYYKSVTQTYRSCSGNFITPELIYPLLPKRKTDIHKGSCGRLYACAGSKGLTGAAILSCTSALKCGAGLITLGCCESLNSIFEICLREVMTKPLSDNEGMLDLKCAGSIVSEAEASDVCLIGPGVGRSDDITKITQKIFESEKIYAVADADALYAASENMQFLKNHRAKLILTPHIGEFARMTKKSADEILKDTEAYAVEFAKEYNVTLILKSHRTVIASPDGKCLVNPGGNPGMATGGSGDVLSGAAASFAAQGMEPFDAAILGVYIHSLAADMAAMEFGEYSLTPSDIIDFLPYAIKFSTGR